VPLGPAAAGSSNPNWLVGSNGSAVPSPAPQVYVNPEDLIPLQTRMKVKKINGYLDQLAASLI
jgi:hypothetical protein